MNVNGNLTLSIAPGLVGDPPGAFRARLANEGGEGLHLAGTA